MLIIPAIDIKNGQVVRLHQGDYNQASIYESDPVFYVEKYLDAGFNRIHIVDLDGSKDSKPGLTGLVRTLKREYDFTLQLGGGIRTSEDIKIMIDSGVDKIIIGSMAFYAKEIFQSSVEFYGSDRFILAADVLNEVVRIQGWTVDTEVTIFNHIRYGVDLGIKEFLITDISKDGTLTGPSFELYEKIKNEYPDIDIIVSGGISSKDDLDKLKKADYFGTVIGKALYENKLTPGDLAKYAG